MLRTTLSRLARCATAALLMIGLAGPALAGHDDDDWGNDRPAYPVYRHGDHCDRDSDRGYDRGVWGRGYGGYGGYYEERGERREHSSYACRPCGRHWNNRDDFYRHLSRHHHHGFRG